VFFLVRGEGKRGKKPRVCFFSFGGGEGVYYVSFNLEALNCIRSLSSGEKKKGREKGVHFLLYGGDFFLGASFFLRFFYRKKKMGGSMRSHPLVFLVACGRKKKRGGKRASVVFSWVERGRGHCLIRGLFCRWGFGQEGKGSSPVLICERRGFCRFYFCFTSSRKKKGGKLKVFPSATGEKKGKAKAGQQR